MDSLYTRLTDKDWYDFLYSEYSHGNPLKEINFWMRGCKQGFNHINPGDMFAFKLHNKHTAKESIDGEFVGGATYIRYEVLSIVDAWKKYGVCNGASSLDNLIMQIGKNANDRIGCIILSNPFFFEKADWTTWKNDPKEGYFFKKFTYNDSTHCQVINDFNTSYLKTMNQINLQKEIANLIIPEDSEAQIEQATKLSLDSLRYAASKTQAQKIQKKSVLTTQYQRSPYIAELAKREANGLCQLCGNKAPFCTQDGNPYLESHHIIWLSEGGSDTIDNVVAICPNCHKRIHILKDPNDTIALVSSKRKLYQ